MDKAYSTNDENYNHETASDALQALADNDELVEGRTYYEIDTKAVNLADYLVAGCVLEIAEERLYDNLGEVAEDAYSVTNEAAAEWDAFVAGWAERNLKGRYWECVGKARELKVTAEDVARYGA